ncbi:MAG: type II toxin-antitoxin system VapC family toxin [Candidatus Limnocylindrales bacterium]
MTTAYLDASAIVKLVVAEPESEALHRWYVEATQLLTSRIGVIETIRASARRDHDPNHRARIISDLEIIEVTAAIGTAAATVGSSALRTLDAIHIATAMSLGPDLEAFVTYDDRMAEAARSLGLPVVRPA